MTFRRTARAMVIPAVAAVAVAAPLTAAPPAVAAASSANVYVIQGVDATKMALSVDGRSIASAAAAKTIVGPLHLSPGSHTIAARSLDNKTDVSASWTLKAGESLDVVLHRRVDPDVRPVFTTYVNDLSPVSSGSGRLVVAHDAAVGPADVRVKHKVLFSNIASGESLTLTVPKGSYPVDIVPTATTGPAVFGPVDLPVAAKALTRVFAIGVAATHSMDAVVQVLPLASRGSGSMPTKVNAGSGGQAQGLIRTEDPSSMTFGRGTGTGTGTGTGRSLVGSSLPALGTGLLGAGLMALTAARRRRSSHR